MLFDEKSCCEDVISIDLFPAKMDPKCLLSNSEMVESRGVNPDSRLSKGGKMRSMLGLPVLTNDMSESGKVCSYILFIEALLCLVNGDLFHTL